MHDFELTDRAKKISDSPVLWTMFIDFIDYLPISLPLNVSFVIPGDFAIDGIQLLIAFYAFKYPTDLIGQWAEFALVGPMDLLPSATLTYIAYKMGLLDFLKTVKKVKSKKVH